ncbi:Hypothetical predicted protein [Octopus vulgaris]|nr:Hypothetical predicted protein [Octopus vulgaris]
MERPVVWMCSNYKYECDRTCADGPDYKVTQDGDTSTLWIKKVTKKCLTWIFADDNLNVRKIDLEIKSFSSANIYKITQSGIAVLNGCLTLTITIPYMKRPVVWMCRNYKYECDKTCADGPDYKVTQDGDTSTLWIKKVTKKCLTWIFDDDNLNVRKIDLEIKSFSSANIYKITQSGIAVLNGCLTLSITIPDMKRPVVWKCRNYKYECDKTCVNSSQYKVTHFGDTSTLWIRKVTEKCSTWKFDDDNLNVGKIDLEIKSFSSDSIYKIYQSGTAELYRDLNLVIYIPHMKRPVAWICQDNRYECDRTCADGPDYKVTHFGDTSKLWIKNVTKECLTWRFEDDNLKVGRIDLKIKITWKLEKPCHCDICGEWFSQINLLDKHRHTLIWKRNHVTDSVPFEKSSWVEYEAVKTVTRTEFTKDCEEFFRSEVKTKFFSLFVFPSWFLKLPIASSHNYKIMAKWILFCLLFVTFLYLSRAQKYKITQSGPAVLNRNLTLSITISDMKRPVVWKCQNYKYECDRTCADGPYYKVIHSGDTSKLWIRKVTKKCSTWKFEDDNLNIGRIDLKIKRPAVLNGNLTLSITISDMKRPVVWKCHNYKYECDRTCVNSSQYKVTHLEDTSTLWIRNVTKECLTWKFDDDNLNAADIDLEIKNPKPEPPKPKTYSTLEIVGIIFGSLFLAGLLVGLALFGYKYFKK